MKIIESGKCGDNVSYEFTEDGVLRIFGIGGIFNYNHEYFYKKENIKRVIIAKGITVIGLCAFSGCVSLVSIDIPNSVTTIGSGAFEGCTSLVSIDIPNSVTTIGSSAFKGCKSLELINIPNSVLSINDCAFEGTAWFNNQLDGVIYINDKFLYRYKGVMPVNTHIQVKEGITKICSYAFLGCTSLESIEVPNSVTEIGSGAFSGCTSLVSIDIPNSVTEIGSGAFSGCTSLVSIDIPNSVSEIDLWAFDGCTSLELIKVPNSVIEIDLFAFEGCTSLKSIDVDVLNDNYLSEKGILYNKDKSLLIRYPLGKLESLFVVPNSVAEIGDCAFYECTSLETIDIPNSVTEIGESAFKLCTALKSIDIPNSVTNIGYNAFYGCTSLESVNIPDSVEMIENCKFEGCTSLKIMNVPSKCSFCCCKNFIGRETIISSATEPFKMKCKYRKCGPYERLNFSIPVYVPKGSKKAYHEHEEWGKFTNIKEIDGRCGEDSYYELLGNGTLNIFGKDEMYDDFVFDKSKIKKVRVTENICMIGANAFKDCRKLRIVEIESPLEEIADGAFSGCENIFSMTIASEIPPIVSEHTLEGLMRTIEIRVPANAIRYYKAAKYWNEFTNYVAID